MILVGGKPYFYTVFIKETGSSTSVKDYPHIEL